MKVTYNTRKDEYEVTLTANDLETAFKSEKDFQSTLHTIIEKTYGQVLADKLFPIQEFDLEGYIVDLLTTIKKIHDENVENKAEYYNYTHLFSKEEIDNITEAWDKCKWVEIV